MSIDGVNGRTSYIGTSILNIRAQLDDLTQQLASGRVSTTYAGQGANRGFALSLRAQVSGLDAYADTAKNVNTRLNVVNLALQGLSDIGTSVKKRGQYVDHRAQQQRSDLRPDHGAGGVLERGVAAQQPDRRPLSCFPDAPPTRQRRCRPTSCSTALGTQAGLKQLINERRQADQGVSNMGHLTVSSPPLTTTVTSLAEDGSSFGLKLGSVSSSLTGATVTQPTGTPPAVTVDLGAVNPNDGDKITFNFNLPDGTTESIALTATTKNPPPTGSFLIGVDTAATTANLQAALTSSIQTLGDTSLVAASAIAASDNFFNPSATVTGSCGQQPGRGAGADHRRYAALGRCGNGFAGHELCGGRHHYGQRHADHLRRIGRDRQPAQHHRQRSDPAGKDRFDHRHRYAVDRHRRRDRAARRRRREPDGYQFEHGRVRGAGLQRHRRAQIRRRCASTVRRLPPPPI